MKSQTFEAQKENEIVTVSVFSKYGLFGMLNYPPNITPNVLSGAGLGVFEMCLHDVTSLLEVNRWKEKP